MSKPVLSVSRTETGRLHVQVEAHAVEVLALTWVDMVQTALGVEWIRLPEQDNRF